MINPCPDCGALRLEDCACPEDCESCGAQQMASLSDKTEIGLPLKNLLGLLGAVATAVWAYFGIIERLNNIETRATLFEADLLKAADQKPIDQEQYMLLEFNAKQLETIQKEMESMMNNRVNIDFLKDQVSKLQKDVEILKDKVRQNGSHQYYCYVFIWKYE